MIDKLKSWAALSPIASGLRTAIALGVVSCLNFVLEQYLSWGLPLWAQFAIASAIPPLLRAVNTADGVFGKGATTVDELAEEPEA